MNVSGYEERPRPRGIPRSGIDPISSSPAGSAYRKHFECGNHPRPEHFEAIIAHRRRPAIPGRDGDRLRAPKRWNWLLARRASSGHRSGCEATGELDRNALSRAYAEHAGRGAARTTPRTTLERIGRDRWPPAGATPSCDGDDPVQAIVLQTPMQHRVEAAGGIRLTVRTCRSFMSCCAFRRGERDDLDHHRIRVSPDRRTAACSSVSSVCTPGSIRNPGTDARDRSCRESPHEKAERIGGSQRECLERVPAEFRYWKSIAPTFTPILSDAAAEIRGAQRHPKRAVRSARRPRPFVASIIGVKNASRPTSMVLRPGYATRFVFRAEPVPEDVPKAADLVDVPEHLDEVR